LKLPNKLRKKAQMEREVYPRRDAEFYYDLSWPSFDDVNFYKRYLSSSSRVLELGCGTGRVLLPLAGLVSKIVGVDKSPEMIRALRQKLAALPNPSNIAVVEGDITNLQLGEKFDLITAPFRVFQALETDQQVDGFFEVVRSHLAPGGSCILNVFKPNREREQLKAEWCKAGETVVWEKILPNGDKAVHSDRRSSMDKERLVLYPELIYRLYRDEKLVEEVIVPINMRCYYQEDLKNLVMQHGFEITGTWGGYSGEAYGDGGELVLKFR